MNDVDLSSINLNLLVALEALLREVHVTRAARRCGVSQSAMSHQLASLRTLFDDPLLVRGPEGSELTQRAQSLQEPVRIALAGIRSVFRNPTEFDPQTATGRFCIGTSDSLAAFLMPDLVRRLSLAAPALEISVLECNPRDFSGLLGSNDVQLTIGPAVSETGLEQAVLFEDSFVCALHREHALANQQLDLEAFVHAKHVLISPTGIGVSFVDEALAAKGLSRHVGFRTTSFLLAPIVVSQTDLIVTAPKHCIDAVAEPLGLLLREPPIELPSLHIAMAWHHRYRADAAHTWLRAQIEAAVPPKE